MTPIPPSTTPQEAPRPGLLAWVVGLVRSVIFPLDAVLKGMVGAGLSLESLCAFLGLSRDALFDHIVRLGLRTPPDTPLRKPTARSWTVEDTQKLIAWRMSGVHPHIIGESLARIRTAGAVRSKSRRLGLSAPPRKQLFRPTPEQLTLPLPIPAGRPAAPPAALFDGDRSAVPAAPAAPLDGDRSAVPASPATLLDGDRSAVPAVPAAPPDSNRPARSAAAAAAATQHPTHPRQDKAPPPPAPKPVPTHPDQVDFSDLLWIGSLSGGRGNRTDASQCARTNLAVVHVVGALTLSGLRREHAARRVGLSEPAFRTLRTRCGVPPIANREAQTDEFDIEVALETIKRADLIIIKSIASSESGRPPAFFWRRASDRHIRRAPSERQTTRRGEVAVLNPVTVVTRAVLDAETRHCGRRPHPGPTIIVDRAEAARSAPPRAKLPIIAPRPQAAECVRPATLPASHAAFATQAGTLGR